MPELAVAAIRRAAASTCSLLYDCGASTTCALILPMFHAMKL
jgi:hypothetical protein